MPLKDFLPKGAGRKLSKQEAKEQKEQKAHNIHLVKEYIYPILLKHSKSIKDAQNICKNLIVGLDATFQFDINSYMKKRNQDKLETFNLKGAMNEGSENTAEWALVEALKDEKVGDVKALIDGMDKQIGGLTDKELLERKLDSLVIEFLN